VWQNITPGQEFDFSFLDEAIANQYSQDERTGAVVDWAAALSIFISCTGLFGLVTLSVSNRLREIAVRKVLGASVGRIILVISKDFLILVGIAALVAIPLAWIAMNYWLSDFAYRIDLSWWVFFLAVVPALLIAFVTICTQAVRAALANPIHGIRSE
jgi:putative ABC transport system permease protein